MCIAAYCVLLVASLCVHSTHASTQELFNYEVAKRTQDEIETFLDFPHFPLTQLANMFKIGGFTFGDPDLLQSVRRLQYSQFLTADNSVAVLQAGFENAMYSGYLRTNEKYLRVVDNVTSCQHNRFLPRPCVDILEFDEEGTPTNTTSAFPYDCRQRPWYKAAKANGTVWSDIYPFANGMFGFTLVTPLIDKFKNFVGVAGVDYLLVSLEEFLVQSFYDPTNERVVYIVDQDNMLIAASAPNVTTTQTGPESWRRVSATDCGNDLIRKTAHFLQSVDTAAMENILVTGGYYVQVTHYSTATGIKWDIVVVRPVVTETDYIKVGSASFNAVCLLAGTCVAFTLFLVLWLLKYQNMQIWRAAQPVPLFLILCSNLMCVCSAFVLIGAPSDGLCLLRQWWISLSITFTTASFLAKMLRVYIIITTDTALQLPFSTTHMAAVIVGILCVQCIVQVVWSLKDPLRLETRSRTVDGLVVQHDVCSTDARWGFALTAAVICVLFVGGSRLAYLSRKLSEAFAESRALMFSFYHGTFLTVFLVLVATLSDVSMQAITLFVIIAMLWFTLTTQAALFVPRIHRQIEFGDFTIDEVRAHVKHHMPHTPQNPTHPSQVGDGDMEFEVIDPHSTTAVENTAL